MSKLIQTGSLVEIHYSLSTDDTLVDTTEGQAPLKIQVGKKQLHPAIEAQLQGLEEGAPFEKVLDPSLAFGEYDPELKIQIAKKRLPEKWQTLEKGMEFETLDHNKKKRLFKVIEANKAHIVIDGNSPLAGQVIYLEGRVVSVDNSAVENSDVGNSNTDKPIKEPSL